MILVFGKTGQLATELQRQGDVTALGRDEVDLENVLACAGAIRKHKPDTVINAAAYTAVDRAEEDGASAALINGAAPRIMAEAAAEVGAKFIHVSTDYVFDGTGDRPWKPEDRPRPQGAYGRTKLSGEEGIRRAGGSHVILRTSWVFSDVGSNFVKTMLRLGAERGELRVVDDQIGGPTPAADIAAALLKIADRLGENPELGGTYHFAGAPDVSWADFAREIFAQSEMDVAVTGIPTADYPTPAKRPLNSRLDCASTESVFGIARPDWREGLAQVLKRLGAGTR